jgi:4-amino-4-deoxy-L-arabinose transferase-like glycosyltransferase
MRLQEWIHRLEVGGGTRYVRLAVAVFGFLALTLLYDLFEYRNLAEPEAMDVAQLARNVARGNGFTTQVVRPLSLHLVEQHQMSAGRRTNDFAMLDHGHPDLANPPLYPLLLAGAMNLLPFDYEIPRGRQYRHYQPDLLISLVNQLLFLVLAVLTFRLAVRLFDHAVAWGSVIAMVGSRLFWEFSISGLSTMLLLNLFVLIALGLTEIERRARASLEPGQESTGRLVLLGLVIGTLVGLGALTRYSFGWLILPVFAFLLVYVPRVRVMVSFAAVLAFLLVLTPWLLRNHNLSGTFFGTAGYACLEDIYPLKSHEIERSLQTPAVDGNPVDAALRKFMVNLPPLLRSVALTGESWLTPFFLVGLLVPFVDPGRNRLRLFLVGSLLVWLVVQALGRTSQPTDAQVNGENLTVLLAPVMFIFGMALFLTLLDQLPLTIFRGRELITTAFLLLLALPLILSLLPPRRIIHAFPPYHPLYIQTLCGWMEKDELVMSDLPWADAWYGDRQCVWLTRRLSDPALEEDFYAINDRRKRIRALHLSHETLDQPMFSEFYGDQERGTWGHFTLGLLQAHGRILDTLAQYPTHETISRGTHVEIENLWRRTFLELAPEGFPLRQCPLSYIKAGQLFLTDRNRWSLPTP